MIKKDKTDLWDSLSDHHKEHVATARKQLKKGNGIPHKAVVKKHKKKQDNNEEQDKMLIRSIEKGMKSGEASKKSVKKIFKKHGIIIH